MIVVPASSQVNGNVAEQFILSTLGRVSPYGQKHSGQILNAFMAFSSLGNVIVSTYTAAQVKQEIAKEGILPFSKLIARNYDALSRLTSCFRRRPASYPGQKVMGRVEEDTGHEKTPIRSLDRALVLLVVDYILHLGCHIASHSIHDRLWYSQLHY
jgi:hypothetical protein